MIDGSIHSFNPFHRSLYLYLLVHCNLSSLILPRILRPGNESSIFQLSCKAFFVWQKIKYLCWKILKKFRQWWRNLWFLGGVEDKKRVITSFKGIFKSSQHCTNDFRSSFPLFPFENSGSIFVLPLTIMFITCKISYALMDGLSPSDSFFSKIYNIWFKPWGDFLYSAKK